jgi:hypothetical protein
MNIDLSNEETAALARLVSTTIDDDRYPHSQRIMTLGVLAKIRPEPPHAPLPPRKQYGRRRRG